MECSICGCWVEIEEPNPTDLDVFLCDDCLSRDDDPELVGDGKPRAIVTLAY